MDEFLFLSTNDNLFNAPTPTSVNTPVPISTDDDFLINTPSPPPIPITIAQNTLAPTLGLLSVQPIPTFNIQIPPDLDNFDAYNDGYSIGGLRFSTEIDDSLFLLKIVDL